MEPNSVFYRRRISEELASAERSVTGAARLRHYQFIDAYLSHLEAIGERPPITRSELARLKAYCGDATVA